MKRILFTSVLFLFISTLSGQGEPTPLSVTLTPYITNNIDFVADIQFLGDRMFIVQKDGKIKMADNGNVLPYLFLDISSKVVNEGERGLLGLAFDPDFALNRTFYVNYINTSNNTVIASYQADVDSLFSDPSTENILLTIDQPYTNHNGGQLAFGPDGYLYIGMGDGGSGGDPENRAQNPGTLIGKMLRLEVNSNFYGTPDDNPFVNSADTLDEIWAMGVRNPWRFSFDKATGDLWIADVGQNAWEEIDFQPAGSAGGQNYGWRCFEGTHPYNTSGCGPYSDYDPPVYEYSHSGGDCSVTGGYVYRGTDSELLNGVYLFIDYCSGRLRGIRNPLPEEMEVFDFGTFGFDFSTFGQDSSGEMFAAKLGGTIYKVEDPCHSQIPELVFENGLLTVDEGLMYYYYLDGELIETSENNSYEPQVSGTYYCVVKNQYGCNIKSNEVLVTGVGIIEEGIPGYRFYPNPFGSFLEIEGNIENIHSILISDLSGKVVWEQNEVLSKVLVFRDKLKAGIYIMNVELKNSGSYSVRILKY